MGFDLFDDVGLLKVDPRERALEPVPLGDSSQVVVGEPVAAIGSPFGEQSSLAVGVVSATRRSISSLTSNYQLVDAIQTDAPINRGNSGGPLFDARGRVIGINAQIRSRTGFSEGVGYAVPINAARRTMEQLIEDGKVSYAYVGVSTADLTPAARAEARLRRTARRAHRQRQRRRPGGRRRPASGRGRSSSQAAITVRGRRRPRRRRPCRDQQRGACAYYHKSSWPGGTAIFTVLRDGRRLEFPSASRSDPSTRRA